MQVTTNHASSSYGMPIILDSFGNPVDYAPGIKRVREQLGLTAEQLAAHCGVSTRSVNSWEQGWRLPPAAALNVMASLISAHPF